MNRKFLTLTTLLMIAAFLMAACQPAAPAVTEAAPETTEVVQEGPITIGYGAPSLDSFQTNVMMSMTRYAQEKGWQVVTSNANFDAEAQANEVDYWISLGTDGIVVVPIDSKAICASVKRPTMQYPILYD